MESSAGWIEYEKGVKAMQEEVKLSYGEGRYAISMAAVATMDGVSVIITGGERPHVGGLAMSVPRSRQVDDTKTRCDTWITPRPGHRDCEAAAMVSRIICEEIGMTAAVTAGIHIENAAPEEIRILMENSREAARLLIKKIKELG